ncbi:hypothetical protein J4464_05265 [Candidatus Woesearchaeota archaeon]|nr:hypothetical protein [Candidatus Woesearchaeota archaeon]
MPELIYPSAPLLGAVTDILRYLDARKQAEELAREHGLKVADMPLATQAMGHHPEVRAVVRHHWIDTISVECHGFRDNTRSYEAWHSVGSMATEKGLEDAIPTGGAYAFMPIAHDEWAAVGKGSYDVKNIVRVDNLMDLRAGNIPAAGAPYTISLMIPEGYRLIPLATDTKEVIDMHGAGKLILFERGELNADQFRMDDRVASVCGSPENVEILHGILFGKKEGGGEGRSSFGSYHRIHELGFGNVPMSRPLFLGNLGYDGLSGYDGLNNYARFLGVR